VPNVAVELNFTVELLTARHFSAPNNKGNYRLDATYFSILLTLN